MRKLRLLKTMSELVRLTSRLFPSSVSVSVIYVVVGRPDVMLKPSRANLIGRPEQHLDSSRDLAGI